MRDGGAGGGDEGSPEPSTEKVTGTTRKCANCGQVGHIKTNKKYVCSNCSHGEQEQQQDGAENEAAAGERGKGAFRPPKWKSRKRSN